MEDGYDEFTEIFLKALNVKVYNINGKPNISNYFDIYGYFENGDENGDSRAILENVTYDETVKIYGEM